MIACSWHIANFTDQVNEILAHGWQNQAITQACAFPSPFWESMSVIGIYRQLLLILL